jgi:hypothetical protein
VECEFLKKLWAGGMKIEKCFEYEKFQNAFFRVVRSSLMLVVHYITDLL